MIWFNRFLMLLMIFLVGMTGWTYGETGSMVVLGVGIFILLATAISACLFAEIRYNNGYVAGMEWLKALWNK